MEYIIAPMVNDARQAELNRPEVRFRREWLAGRDVDRYEHLLRRAHSRLSEAATHPFV